MRVSKPTSAARLKGATRSAARVAAAAFALLLATPLTATVWTRSNLSFRIPRGGRVDIDSASYAGRDWSVALTALEVKEDSRPAEHAVATVWVFHYTNTDKAPHYIALNVRCTDALRNDRARFTVKTTLQGDRPNGDRVEVRASVRDADWRSSIWAKVTVDFLSTPEG